MDNDTAVPREDPPPPNASAAASSPAQLELTELITKWQSWDHARQQGPAELYAAYAARAVHLGENLLGVEIAMAGLQFSPADPRLRRVQALALARSGASAPAQAILSRLQNEGFADEETLTMLARTHKDLWEQSGDPELLRRACDGYERAYRLYGGAWSGINAATLAACLHQTQRAGALAEQVRRQSQWVLGECGSDADEYWPLATLGEAALVLGYRSEAQWYYRQAAAAARNRYGNIGTTRRNAKLLFRALGEDWRTLDDWLPLPRVVVFAGHMIDQPRRPAPRFPAALAPAVSREIRKKVDELNAGFGYASGACGSDILFLEAIADRGGELNVVLPYDVERFVNDSVCVTPDRTWEDRFRQLLRRPGTRVTTASEGLFDLGLANVYGNLFILGMAGLRADQLGAELMPLAVWDGGAAAGAGGTADTVAQWRRVGHAPVVIDTRPLLSQLEAVVLTPGPAASAPPPRDEPQPDVSLKALLFADVVGFSKLDEHETPLFVQHFLGGVARLTDELDHKPLQSNTWGDGLYFTFETAAAAGQFALALQEFVTNTPWTSFGFAEPLSLRTALHVGPVLKCRNPVTGRDEYIGTHVSRAARIEPITPRGQVYASEVFAAIAFAQRAEGFACDYVGQIGLAKNYGTFPTYHVRRRTRPGAT